MRGQNLDRWFVYSVDGSGEEPRSAFFEVTLDSDSAGHVAAGALRAAGVG